MKSPKPFKILSEVLYRNRYILLSLPSLKLRPLDVFDKKNGSVNFLGNLYNLTYSKDISSKFYENRNLPRVYNADSMLSEEIRTIKLKPKRKKEKDLLKSWLDIISDGTFEFANSKVEPEPFVKNIKEYLLKSSINDNNIQRIIFDNTFQFEIAKTRSVEINIIGLEKVLKDLHVDHDSLFYSKALEGGTWVVTSVLEISQIRILSNGQKIEYSSSEKGFAFAVKYYQIIFDQEKNRYSINKASRKKPLLNFLKRSPTLIEYPKGLNESLEILPKGANGEISELDHSLFSRESVERLIGEGNTMEAIEYLLNFIGFDNEKMRHEIILYKNRLITNNQSFMQGIIDYNTAEVKNNQINNSILESLIEIDNLA